MMVLFLSSQAQWDDAIINNPGTGKYLAGMYGNADYSSSAITSSFAATFLQGGYIDSTHKQQVSSHLRNGNRLGYSLNYGIFGVLYNDTIKGKRAFNFFVALKHKEYLNIAFPSDVFNLAFYGNASYAGKSAQLSPFNLNNISYQQLEIGSVCTNFGGKAKFGLGISFLAGQQMQNINLSNGSLYTDAFGQYIQLTSNAKFNESDTTPGHNYLNGYGASLDFYFSAPYKLGKKNGVITIGITDLGFISWNSHSLTYNKDTSYTYNGITVSSLNDLQNAAINNLSKDSLQNKYFPLTRKVLYTNIPTTLSVNTNTDLGKMHLEIGFWYIFNGNSLGYFYLQGDKKFAHDWSANLQLGYGGYATYNVLAGIAKQIKNSMIKLGINHLQGIILPTEFGGAGLSIELLHTFK
ncbi:MAG TPA: DUF5723 family protein [Bacteroidia bacterium]|jgi:hypothetical protein|nr:DUF5723 family protein [Bacteroidia bacterium]